MRSVPSTSDKNMKSNPLGLDFHYNLHFKQLSGANVKLIEDQPEVTEKTIQISGTPEQAERAQSLLQGFILSSK